MATGGEREYLWKDSEDPGLLDFLRGGGKVKACRVCGMLIGNSASWVSHTVREHMNSVETPGGFSKEGYGEVLDDSRGSGVVEGVLDVCFDPLPVPASAPVSKSEEKSPVEEEAAGVSTVEQEDPGPPTVKEEWSVEVQIERDEAHVRVLTEKYMIISIGSSTEDEEEPLVKAQDDQRDVRDFAFSLVGAAGPRIPRWRETVDSWDVGGGPVGWLSFPVAGGWVGVPEPVSGPSGGGNKDGEGADPDLSEEDFEEVSFSVEGVEEGSASGVAGGCTWGW